MPAPLSPELLKALNLIRRAWVLHDILVDARHHIYLLGPARRLEGLLDRNEWAGPARQTVMRVDAKTTKRDDWKWRSVDCWDDLDYVVTDILSMLVSTPGDQPEWSVIPVPAPGHPQVPTWSVRTQKPVRPKKVPVFSFCGQKKIVFGSPPGPLALRLQYADAATPFILTHTLQSKDLPLVARCGGLLWPSWSFSWKLPPGYGDVIFLASPTVLWRHLEKPTKGVTIHPTDAWSPDTRWLLRREKAVNHELRGDLRFWSGDREQDDGGWEQRGLQTDLLSTGLRPTEIGGQQGSGAMLSAKLLKTWAAVKQRGLHLEKVHADWYWDYPPDLLMSMPSGWSNAGHCPTGDHYPYIEVKTAGPVDISSLAACFYPRAQARRVGAFLDRMGFVGHRVPFAAPKGGPGERGFETEFAQAATRIVQEYVRPWVAVVQLGVLQSPGLSI